MASDAPMIWQIPKPPLLDPHWRWREELLLEPAPGAKPLAVTCITWWCFGGRSRLEWKEGTRTYVFDYCSAPAGVRCRCQREDHDFGDEDPRAGRA